MKSNNNNEQSMSAGTAYNSSSRLQCQGHVKGDSATRSSFLDIFRIILCLGVVVYHYTPVRPSSGPFMVNGFFVMSGFLLASVYVRKPFILEDFYGKKVLRLLPMFLAAIFLGVIFRAATGHPIPESFSWGNFDIVSFCMYYDTPLWYMAVEFVLLLMAPFFIFIQQKKILGIFTLIITFIVSLLFLKVSPGSCFADGLYFSPFARSFQFLMGMYSAYIFAKYRDSKFFNSVFSKIITYVLFSIFLILAVFFMVVKQKEHMQYWNYSFMLTLLSSLFMAILIPFIYNFRLKFTIAWSQTLTYIALLTYPIYLFHVVVYQYVYVFLNDVLNMNNYSLVILLSVLFTIISSCLCMYVEKRFIRAKS